MSYTLDDRLKLAASMVRKGSRVSDVGCDHAYLPIYLIKNKIASSVIASDVRVGPLESARKNVISQGLENCIKTVLSDGLDAIPPDSFDDLTVCGLGGILMCDILSRAPFLKDPSKRLVLQPMTDSELVREWLYQNGFEIITERAVGVSGHIYSVMNAAYTGVERPFEPLLIHLGGLIENSGDAEKEYIEKYLNTLKARLNGMMRAKDFTENQETSSLKQLISLIETKI